MAVAFTIVTGNQHKVDEYRRLLPKTITFDSARIELEEIQSLDPREIVEHKVRQAYDLIGRPVLVEDVTAGLDKLQGLPGPFIKFFELKLGKSALFVLAGEQETAATVTCTIGVYDGGKQVIFGQGTQRGTIVSPRGKSGSGWGFDYVFVPDGYNQTFAEMGPAQKAKLSHRTLAVRDLLPQL